MSVAVGFPVVTSDGPVTKQFPVRTPLPPRKLRATRAGKELLFMNVIPQKVDGLGYRLANAVKRLKNVDIVLMLAPLGKELRNLIVRLGIMNILVRKSIIGGMSPFPGIYLQNWLKEK